MYYVTYLKVKFLDVFVLREPRDGAHFFEGENPEGLDHALGFGGGEQLLLGLPLQVSWCVDSPTY